MPPTAHEPAAMTTPATAADAPTTHALPPDVLAPAGRRLLGTLARAGALLAFDFDGTLAPIVPRPDDARMSPQTRSLLVELAHRARVAIVSGRSVADLLPRLPAPGEAPLALIGNHGNDGEHAPEGHAGRLAQACAQWRIRLAQAFAAEPVIDGIVVEDKGTTLSVHFRASTDWAAAQARIDAAVATLEPPARRIEGKAVVNLLPPSAFTKGDALALLARAARPAPVMYIGDDDTDETAFEIAPLDWLTIRVGPCTSTAARALLARQEDIDQVLDALLAGLRE